jgi:hypothetical protein
MESHNFTLGLMFESSNPDIFLLTKHFGSGNIIFTFPAPMPMFLVFCCLGTPYV